MAAVANSSPPQQMYTILLILTDGEIMDMNETITSIVNCSGLPMSIIIVGVGNANFSSMEALDCDSGVLTDIRGKRAVRDIVQFVPFNKFGGNPVALAAEVLKEVPKQLTEFMEMIHYVPVLPEEVPLEFIAPIQENLPPLNLPNLPNENPYYNDSGIEEPSAPDLDSDN